MHLHNSVSRRFRNQRMMHFLGLAAHVPRPAQLLDVGGTTEFWRDRIPEGIVVTLINLFDQEPLSGMQVMVGDACDLGRFASNSFDIVFSNSVLCLVGGWERQQQMASEIRRVGRRHFVQTANQGFPLDWRTLVPFFHWLPATAQAWFFRRVSVGRYRRAANATEAKELATRVRDLKLSELKLLFPESDIVPERVCGLVKSFMVNYGFERP
jgi:hypothetical protein